MPDLISGSWLDSVLIASLESALCAELGRFIHFGAHALYFASGGAPELLREEKRLLLPVIARGRYLATLRLDEVAPEALEPVLPLLPELAGLCFERIVAGMNRDMETGLESEENLVAELASRISPCQSRTGASFGMLVIDLPEAGAGLIRREAVERILPQISAALKEFVPKDALLARIDKLSTRISFAALFPASGRVGCQRLARKLMQALEQIRLVDPVSRVAAPVQASAGHALYPHDLCGRELALTPFEQALLLRDRAAIAADAAWNADHLAVPAVAWGWIPMLCCRIQEVSGPGLVRFAYGVKAGIRENQRYLVIPRTERWEASRASAEVVVRKAREDDAFAEIIHTMTAGALPETGDGVILIRDNPDSADSCGLVTRASFFERLASAAGARFALAISSFMSARQSDAWRSSAARFVEAIPGYLPAGAFASRYGVNGLISFIPDADAKTAQELFSGIHAAAREAALELASGIFLYPCLNFARDESEACALKALAYARLLPDPHIGIMDAFALAISADKHFSQGEEAIALEEYRQALLLKPDDPMLLNSLGVCLAAVNRSGEAKRCLERALAACGDLSLKARISYNLGTLRQKESDVTGARRLFRLAIRSDSGHLFAWVRLAQTYEHTLQTNAARAFYRHASRLAGDDTDALNTIQRQLARLEKESNEPEKAREILHDSLVRNPSDKASLLLLAQTYIKDDPAMAESLARKCLGLGRGARHVLVEALTALGRTEEARRIGHG